MTDERGYDKRRGTSAQRGYGYRWQKARAAYLAKHPLCINHESKGQVVTATVVDHVKPHKNDMKLFWDSSNWQPLCKECHDSYKQRLEKTGRIAGCNADGIPVDPNHHWNK
ncbi:MAG: HNH endonuclease [Porticoccaceae bacterium]|nr:HNH endonuclease [Porticoccaceae bacterium]